MIRIISLLFFYTGYLFAQKENNIWYFGNYAGVDFNSGAPVALTNSAMYAQEGCSSICDQNGGLLFYTNGMDVWNKNHTIMPNGSGLMGGASSTQASLIIPLPGSSTIYYLFTTAHAGFTNGFRYSIVDMSLNGGLGDVTTKNTAVLTPVTEKLTAVKHANGTDIWVVVHEDNSNKFYSYLLTPSGFSTSPVISATGTIHTGAATQMGQMKISCKAGKLALAIDYLFLWELLDFDNNTGSVSNPITFPAPSEEAYGVEFSPDDTKLYLSTIQSQIFQVDLAAGTNAQIKSSFLSIGKSISYVSGGLTLAPDGKIYFSRGSPPIHDTIGVIAFPNTLGVGCNYIDKGFGLLGKDAGLSSPNLFRNINCGNPPLTVASTATPLLCNNDSNSTAKATPIGTGPYTFSWSTNPTQTDSVATGLKLGTYTVVVTNTNSQTASSSVTITAPTAIVPAVSNLINAGCALNSGSASIIASGGTSPYNYSWSSGETASSVSNLAAGTYICTIKDQNNCSATQTLTINSIQNNIAFSLSQMPETCNGKMDGSATIATAPSGGTAPFTYSWSTTPVQTSSAITGIKGGIYTLTTIDANGCSKSQSISVTSSPGPVVTISNDTTITLGDSVRIFSSGGTSYTWTPTTALSCTSCQNPIAGPTKATWYTVIIQDANGCTNKDSLFINIETPCGEFFIPNAFSPNNDGANDVFRVRGKCINDYLLQVFDRWGEKVFETKDITKGWDGYYKGVLEDTGVFVFILKGQNTSTGELITKKGNVTLIR